MTTVAGTVINTLLLSGARRATKYVSENFTIKASRMHRPDKRNRYTTLVVSIGAPNYEEREFIRKCKRAGEPFPVRKIQLKAWPKKRA